MQMQQLRAEVDELKVLLERRDMTRSEYCKDKENLIKELAQNNHKLEEQL